MTINLIRHGKTKGNLTKKYIGATDESLCAEGRAELEARIYPACDTVIASPMLRCTQTADIIYPGIKRLIYGELRECDFGRFEGKNHSELDGDPEYQSWIDKGGLAPFPGGEDSDSFRERSVRGFLRAFEENSGCESLSFVVHGGTIMSVLERLAVPHKEFYEYMTENAHGYIISFDGKTAVIKDRI